MSSVQPVGRTSELIRLGEALDRLDRGSAVRLAVEGDPGIGKTFLLSELRRRAEERGHLVLAGSGSEFESDFPFGVWVDALDAYVASQELHTDGSLDEGLFSDLAGLLPSLRRSRHGAPSAGADARYAAHRAVRGLLEALADSRPLVLVLDDLHWSDPASAELIAALLRREPAAPVLLALAYRTGQAPAKLTSALAAPGVAIIEVGELSAQECSTLVGDELSAGHRAAIFLQTGGNPFYTLELARASQSATSSSAGDQMAEDAGVPRAVTAALLDEFRSLSPTARALLDAGSIAGDPFDPDLADSIGSLTRQEGMLALDELLDARLLQATDVPRRFAFRHPLVRRAVYDATKGGWRIGAHGRAAATLAKRGASATARAYHVEQSASEGDVEGIRLLLDAGDGSAAHAPAGAGRWYGAALRLMPEDERPTRLRALMSLAQVLALTGDLERSAARLLEAIELVPEAELALRLRLTSACAHCENFLGHHDRAEARLRAALATLPDRRSREAVAAQLDLAAGAFFTFEQEWMCELTGRALETARNLGEPSMIGAAAAAAAHATALCGLVAAAQSAVAEAGTTLDRLPDGLFADHLVAVNRLAWSEFLVERHADSIRHAQRGVTVARAAGRNQFVPLILQAQALSTMVVGDLSAAAALQDDALEVAELAANGYVTCSVLTTSGTVAMQRGDDAGALRAGELSVALVDGIEGGRIPTMARVRLAVTRRELGASAEDTEALVADAGGWELALVPPTWRVLWAETLTRVELAAGRGEQAEACARLAEETAESFPLPLAGALARRARARMLFASGDAGAARDLASDAAARAASAGAPVEAARARVVAGLAAASMEDRDTAIAALREAETCFDRCGAERDRSEVRRDLRRLGARWEPRGRASTAPGGLGSLSRREREVANLVTDRKTNREVAADLFLSEKTVESHLRNIFAKLGVSSRVEVARAVEKDGLPDD
jgi:ATP/maltotriose-dependent transcriptional regulator MalT